MSEEGVEELVQQKQPYLQILADGRVKCTLNGHVMPATHQAVQSFINGSKFRRLEKRAQEEDSFKKYEPFILQSKNRGEKLYCALTCMLINKNVESLRKHMKGKAFLKAKDQFETDKLELMEEPDFEESEASQSEEEGAFDQELLENIEDMDIAIEPSLEQEDSRQKATKNWQSSTAKPAKVHKPDKKAAGKSETESGSPDRRKNKSRKGRRRKGQEPISASGQKEGTSIVKQKRNQQKEDERQSLEQPQLQKGSGQPDIDFSILKNGKRAQALQLINKAKRQKQVA